MFHSNISHYKSKIHVDFKQKPNIDAVSSALDLSHFQTNL